VKSPALLELYNNSVWLFEAPWSNTSPSAFGIFRFGPSVATDGLPYLQFHFTNSNTAESRYKFVGASGNDVTFTEGHIEAKSIDLSSSLTWTTRGSTHPQILIDAGATDIAGTAAIDLQSGNGAGGARKWRMYVEPALGYLGLRDIGANAGAGVDMFTLTFDTGNLTALGDITAGGKLYAVNADIGNVAAPSWVTGGIYGVRVGGDGGNAGFAARREDTGIEGALVVGLNSAVNVGSWSDHPILFVENAEVRGRLTGGNLGIGGTPSVTGGYTPRLFAAGTYPALVLDNTHVSGTHKYALAIASTGNLELWDATADSVIGYFSTSGLFLDGGAKKIQIYPASVASHRSMSLSNNQNATIHVDHEASYTRFGTDGGQGVSFATNGATSANVALQVDVNGHITTAKTPSVYAYATGFPYSLSTTGWHQITGVIAGYGAGGAWSTYHNNGSHFNTSTGNFTAPVTGRYLVTASATVATGGSTAPLQLAFAVGGSIRGGYAYAQTDSTDAYECMTISNILHVTQGNAITLHVYTGNTITSLVNGSLVSFSVELLG
jgi:hypothetical protein